MNQPARSLAMMAPAVLILLLVAGALAAVYWASLPSVPAIRVVDGAPFHQPASFEQVDFSSAVWKPLPLPARSCDIRCDSPYRAFRHRFARAALPEDPALWLPHFDANAAVYLNGQRVFQLGSMLPPVDVHSWYPQLFRLPAAALVTDQNELVVLLVEQRRGQGGLAPFYLGDYNRLASAHSWRTLLARQLPTGMFWLQLASVLLAVALILRGQRELPLRWFVTIAPAWLWLTLPDNVRSVLDQPYRTTAAFIGFYLMLGITPLFVMSLLQTPPRWLVRALLGFTAFGIALATVSTQWLPVSPYWQFMIPQYLLKASALILIPLLLWQIARYGLRQGNSRLGQGVFACALLPGLFAITDVIRASSGNTEFGLMPLAGGALAIALWLELGNRFALNQQAVREFNNELQARLAEREETLKRTFDSLRDGDRERTLSAERQRLLRDMHDGVAGQMTALIHLAGDPNARREQIVDGLRDGLIDLRIVLDSLNHGDDDLLDALGSFRQRIEPVLSAAGIKLHWQVDPRLVAQGWGADAVLQVYRILQEVVSNTIKHARASELWIALTADGLHSADPSRSADTPGLLLRIRDNGQGFDPQAASLGYGLINLRQRAQGLGARLDMHSSRRGGTVVSLQLPSRPGAPLPESAARAEPPRREARG